MNSHHPSPWVMIKQRSVPPEMDCDIVQRLHMLFLRCTSFGSHSIILQCKLRKVESWFLFEISVCQCIQRTTCLGPCLVLVTRIVGFWISRNHEYTICRGLSRGWIYDSIQRKNLNFINFNLKIKRCGTYPGHMWCVSIKKQTHSTEFNQRSFNYF